jgi:hypothetical protein
MDYSVMFGTLEQVGERPIYGLAENVNSFHPFRLLFIMEKFMARPLEKQVTFPIV